MNPDRTTQHSIDDLFSELSGPSLRYEASVTPINLHTYNLGLPSEDIRRRNSSFTVAARGFYEDSIDDVSLSTQNTTVSLLASAPLTPTLRLEKVSEGQQCEDDVFESLTRCAWDAWHDHPVVQGYESFQNHYEKVFAQRINRLRDPNTKIDVAVANQDVQTNLRAYNAVNNHLMKHLDLVSAELHNKGQAFHPDKGNLWRHQQFHEEHYLNSLNNRAVTGLAKQAAQIEANRLHTDASYLYRRGLTDVSEEASELARQYQQLTETLNDVHLAVSISESLLARDQPNHVVNQHYRPVRRAVNNVKQRLRATPV